jgi:protein O-mannosyl-transferase
MCKGTIQLHVRLLTTNSDRGLSPQPTLLLRVAVIVAVSLCVAAAYVPLLGAGWVYDDLNIVQPSPALKDLAGLRRAISTDLYRQAAPRLEASPYWRPLAMASFWLDTRLGAAPLVLHIGNILLHALAAALLVLVVMRRHGGIAGVVAAAAAASWWALHPENVETVAWISCRYDLLCGFVLLCLLDVPWRPGPLRAALYGLMFLAGLLSKEGFFMMAAVVVAMDFADRRPLRAAAPRWAAIALALVIWMALRAAVGVRSFDLPTPGAVLTMLRIYPEAIAIYFRRALAAVPLTISHPYMPGGAFGVVAGMAIFAALVAAAVRWRRLAAPVAIFLAGLVPIVGAMTMFHDAPERYFYVPSIGLALLVGELVALAMSAQLRPGYMTERQAKLVTRLVRVVVPAAVGIVMLLGIFRLERRLPDWQSNDTLWAAALRTDPLDPQANFNQAIAAGRRGDWGEALRAIEVAAHGDPSSGRIAGTYAWALLRTADFAGAVREAEHATVLAPYQPDCWYYLAFARHKIGDHAGELAAIEKLLRIAPDFPGAQEMHAIAACEVSGRKDCP